MADSTRIEEIISQAALRGFDELNAKVNASVENIERLVGAAVKTNTAFASIKSPKAFNAEIKKMDNSEKELIKTTEELAVSQAALDNAAILVKQKQAINDLVIKNKELTAAIKEQDLNRRLALDADRLAASQGKVIAAEEKSRINAELEAEKLLILQKQREVEEAKKLVKLEEEKQAAIKLTARLAEDAISREEARQRRLAEIPARLKAQAERDAASAEKTRKAAEAATAAAAVGPATTAPGGTTAAIGAEAKAVDDLSDAYAGLIKASVENQLASKQLLEQRKALYVAFRTGKISEEEYKTGLEQVRAAQIRLTASNQEINKGLKTLGKEAAAASGSLNKMRATLDIALQAFDRLSEAEKRSAIGQQLENKIKRLTRAITEQEQATGRFQRNVGNYKAALSGLSNVVGQLVTATVGFVGLSTLTVGLTNSIDEFNQAEQSVSRLKNILENVGRLDVFAKLEKDANDFAKVYQQLDNDNITNVFQKLVIYGKLTEGEIKSLTSVIIDFSAKSGLSLEDAAQKIILALEGNGRALKEYGIDMKDAGSTTEALGLIMTELKPKVEGAAKAFGETTAGQIAITRQEINNIKEQIGGQLQPVLKNFYAFLSQALQGIPMLFGKISENIETNIGQLNLYRKVAGDILSLDFTSAATRIGVDKAQKESNNQRLASEKEILNIRKQATAFATDATAQFNLIEENKKREIKAIESTTTSKIKKAQQIAEIERNSTERQDSILKNQIALEDESLRNYDALVKSGKRFTAEGKQAGVELYRNAAIVKELRKALDRETDKRVIGGGDPDDSFKHSSRKIKENQTLLTINKKFFDAELKDEVVALKQISKNESFHFTDRINKRKEAFEIEKQLAETELQTALNNEAAKLNAIRGKGGSKVAIINAQNEFNATVESLNVNAAYAEKTLERDKNNDILQIKNKYNLDSLAADRKLNEDSIVLIESQVKAEKDKVKAGLDNRLDILQAAGDIELKSIEDAKNARLALANGEGERARIEDKFNKQRLKSEINTNRLKLMAALETQEELLKIARKVSDDPNQIDALLKQIAELKKQIAELQGKSIQIDIDVDQAKIDAIVKAFDKIKEAAGSVFDLIGGAINAYVVAQKNALQDQSDEIERSSAAEVAAINASTDTAEKKAARLQAVESRSAAQKEIIAQRQRQLDQRNAEFAKARAIAEIILNTLVAVTKVSANLPLALATAAFGAAQLAIAIATPVPRFEHGTEDAPGGLAYVNEKRKELIITPDGRVIETPGTPVVMNIPKHSWVIDDSRKLMESGIGKRDLVNVKVNENGEMFYMLGGKLEKLGRIIKNKTETHISRKGDGWEQIKKSAGNQTRYLN